MPGAYALAVMPHGPSSPATTLVKWATAAFDDAYAAPPIAGTMAANEAALIIRPDCCRFITGAIALHIRKVPVRFTSYDARQVSSARVSNGPPDAIPALLTRMSTRP